MNTIKTILIFWVYTLLVCCSPGKNVDLNNDYVILDSVKSEGKYWERNWKDYNFYPIVFLGILKDSININHKLHEHFIPPPPFPHQLTEFEMLDDSMVYFIENFDSSEYKKNLKLYEQNVLNHPLEKYRIMKVDNRNSIYISDSVDIKVDTNITIQKNHYRNGIYNAYPIIVSNKSNDTIKIGLKAEITAILEAKDSIGNWSEIIACTNHGLDMFKEYVLPPKYSIISATYQTKGNYKTKLRIKLGNNYSNEWTGKINYNQFYWNYEEMKNKK